MLSWEVDQVNRLSKWSECTDREAWEKTHRKVSCCQNPGRRRPHSSTWPYNGWLGSSGSSPSSSGTAPNAGGVSGAPKKVPVLPVLGVVVPEVLMLRSASCWSPGSVPFLAFTPLVSLADMATCHFSALLESHSVVHWERGWSQSAECARWKACTRMR